jgi:hypothetical protein
MLKGTEIIYTDLNAIISNFEATADGCFSDGVRIDPPSGTCDQWFREFTVLFHDELETGKPAFPEYTPTSLSFTRYATGSASTMAHLGWERYCWPTVRR